MKNVTFPRFVSVNRVAERIPEEIEIAFPCENIASACTESFDSDNPLEMIGREASHVNFLLIDSEKKGGSERCGKKGELREPPQGRIRWHRFECKRRNNNGGAVTGSGKRDTRIVRDGERREGRKSNEREGGHEDAGGRARGCERMSTRTRERG